MSWNPRKQHPDIVKPAGPIDPEIGLLYFDTPQSKPLATFVNFALHPDTTGGTGPNAVWYRFGSRHTGIFNVLMGDGSVRGLRNNIDFNTWVVLGGKADGQILQNQ